MRTTQIAALLCAVSLVVPCAHTQQGDDARKQFLEFKAKAEKGDAEAQNKLGGAYFKGEGVEQNFAEAAFTKFWFSEPQPAPTFGFTGDWRNSLVERPASS